MAESKVNYTKLVENKIYTIDGIKGLVNQWKVFNKKVVFTNGVFDLLHQGHLQSLYYGASLGDKLVIGMNSDSSTKLLKGPHRPVQDGRTRAMVLASLQFVDAVIEFEEETPLHLIESILPDVLLKGGDYKKTDVVGGDVVTANGGEVVIFPRIAGHSTSEIIDWGFRS